MIKIPSLMTLQNRCSPLLSSGLRDSPVALMQLRLQAVDGRAGATHTPMILAAVLSRISESQQKEDFRGK